MPGPDRPSFGRRNAPPKAQSGHEAIKPPELSAQVVHDTVNNISEGQIHADLKELIRTDPDIKAKAGEIAMLVGQGRKVAIDSLQTLTNALHQLRGKK